MRREIFCGVLMLAGCGRPTSENQAVQSPRRDVPKAEREGAVQSTGDAAGRDPLAAAEMIPDPVYTPREEDRATLIADATPGFSRASLFDDYYESSGPEDRDLLRKMIERGELVELEGKLPVLVLRNLDPADAREPGRHYGVEVRVLAGARRGETWFVDESAVARLVPKVVHPPLAPGSYATVARPGTIAYAGWEAFDTAARPPGEAASQESFRLGEGVRVVVQEVRGEAVRVRVDSGSGAVGRLGVVARPDLRPMVPKSSAIPSRPADR